MQYETLMKSYEIAKAELEVAKKRQQLDNVLAERNVRMFINGQWQWVANTQDVIDAQNEYADAKYEAEQAQLQKTQTDSLNDLTAKQDKLGTIINQFESGVIDLDTAVGQVKQMFDKLPTAIQTAISNLTSGKSGSFSSGSSGSSSDGGSGISSEYVSWAKSQMEKNSKNWHTADADGKIALEAANQSLGEIIDSDYDKATGTWKHKHADGTRYTPGGLTLMGEDGIEAYISSNGHLIPINQPTIGNIGAGGVVFNQEQMANLRSLWDLSNIAKPYYNFIGERKTQQVVSNDNRIIINGMTVDSGSSDGQALISALRRYVGNH